LRRALIVWGAAEERPSPQGCDPLLSLERPTFGVETLRETCGSNPRLIREILELLLKGTPGRLERLEAAIAAGDSRQTYREAHGLKGAFLTAGGEALAETCQALITLSDQGDRAALEETHRRLPGQWDQLREEALRYLESLSARI